ncbi:MAG: alkaline phosphatase D family protein [Planctomycetota bacterium]
MADPLHLGPVVGEVTDTSARIVVQAAVAGTVELTLYPDHGNPSRIRRDLAAEEIDAFVFEALKPDTRYRLEVTVGGNAVPHRQGRVRTKQATPTSLHMAAVSCNFTTRQGASRLWERLWHKWVEPGTVSTVLHIGDQIYADTTFGECLADVRRNGKGAAVRRRCRRAFEKLYQLSWNYEATRQVLAHTSNLMIWDDHELRNSWGGMREDRDPASAEFFVGLVAREVFQHLQRALWGDVDAAATHEGHAHAYGELGVLFLDQRTARSFSYTPQRPYLGVDQWRWLREELRSGRLANARALVLVTSVPLCYVSTFSSGNFDWMISDLRDHWTHPDHRTELIEMLVEIRRWLDRDPGRTVLVVGGDVHVGGKTQVLRPSGNDWVPMCTQLITSPITNAPPGFLTWFGLRELLLRGVHQAGEHFRFDHDESSFTNRRNFAVLTLRSEAGAPAVIHGSLECDADD